MDGSFPVGGSFGGRGGPAGGRGGFRGNESNAKTRICMRWQSGDCRFGDNCNFAHGEAELRPLPPRSGQAGGRGRRDFPDDRGGGGFYQGGGPGGGYGGPQGGGYGGRGGGGYGGGYGGPQGGYGGPGGGYGAPGGGYGGPGGAAAASPGGGYYGAPGGGGGGNPGWGAAQQGNPVQGPGDWVQYHTADTNEAYFHNHRTGETTWDKPLGFP